MTPAGSSYIFLVRPPPFKLQFSSGFEPRGLVGWLVDCNRSELLLHSIHCMYKVQNRVLDH